MASHVFPLFLTQQSPATGSLSKFTDSTDVLTQIKAETGGITQSIGTSSCSVNSEHNAALTAATGRFIALLLPPPIEKKRLFSRM